MPLQARTPAAAVQGLPALHPAVPYRYVLFRLWFITVTRRSVSLAVASASLTFTALQVSDRGVKALADVVQTVP